MCAPWECLRDAFPCALLQGCAISSPCPSAGHPPATPNPNPLGITPATLTEGLEPLGWVQPCRGSCTLSLAPRTSLCHGSPSAAQPGVPPGHPPVTPLGRGRGVSPAAACPGTQAARRRRSQRAGTVPACGQPGSGTRRQSHRLRFLQGIFVSFCSIPA